MADSTACGSMFAVSDWTSAKTILGLPLIVCQHNVPNQVDYLGIRKRISTYFFNKYCKKVVGVSNQAIDYLEVLYSTREGREYMKYVCEKYGIDKKQITKLKLKI